MTWTTFHRRGETLRIVIELADLRRDGLLPMDAPGVRETFGDELTLLGALHLRWHTRLSGHLEQALMRRPLDDADAVVTAWRETADELPGTRMVLDHYRAHPLDHRMAMALATATEKEHRMLAAMAGRSGVTPGETAAAGAALEQRARSRFPVA
jgi:hypothetical protein